MTRKLRILCVEDSDDDFVLTSIHLRSGGCDADFLRLDTLPAISAALAQPGWDAVLSDMNLRIFTGLDVLEIFKKAGKDIPFIVLSGTIGEEKAAALMKAGASDYVSKDNMARLVPVLLRELKDAEDRRARRKLEERYRRIVETTHEGIWVADVRGRTEFTNQRMAELLGYTVEELGPRTLADFVVHEDGSGTDLRAEMERPAVLKEVRLERRDGSTLWALVESSPMVDERGRPVGRLAMVTDVTERRRADQTRARLAAKEREAQDAARTAEALGRMKSEVIGAFTDELRLPLTTIHGYSDLLDAEEAGPLTAGQRSFVRQIRSNVDLLQRRLDDLRDLVRADWGALELHKAPGDLVVILRELTARLGAAAAEAGVDLSVSLPAGELRADMDSERVAQALGELLWDTVKTTPRGGVVSITARHEGGSHRVEVSAPVGRAAPADDLEPARERGLGRTVARAVVEAHGGELGAEDLPDQRRRAWLTLPAEA